MRQIDKFESIVERKQSKWYIECIISKARYDTNVSHNMGALIDQILTLDIVLFQMLTLDIGPFQNCHILTFDTGFQILTLTFNNSNTDISKLLMFDIMFECLSLDVGPHLINHC